MKKGTHKGCPYGALMGLVGLGLQGVGAGKGHPQGVPLRGVDGPGRFGVAGRLVREKGTHKGCPYGAVMGLVGLGLHVVAA